MSIEGAQMVEMGSLQRRQYIASLKSVGQPNETAPVANPLSVSRRKRKGPGGRRRIPSQHEAIDLEHRKTDRARKAVVSFIFI